VLLSKILTATDCNENLNRIVMPRVLAEEAFGSDARLVHLLDARGHDWEFRHAKWPNGSTCMYLLSGVRGFLKHAQAQPGDKLNIGVLRVKPSAGSGAVVMPLGSAGAPSAGLAGEGRLIVGFDRKGTFEALPAKKSKGANGVRASAAVPVCVQAQAAVSSTVWEVRPVVPLPALPLPSCSAADNQWASRSTGPGAPTALPTRRLGNDVPTPPRTPSAFRPERAAPEPPRTPTVFQPECAAPRPSPSAGTLETAPSAKQARSTPDDTSPLARAPKRVKPAAINIVVLSGSTIDFAHRGMMLSTPPTGMNGFKANFN
ncbi:hypothetical protein T492DRAFT_883674, partial [Pavlovales sp. CCMP2436]